MLMGSVERRYEEGLSFAEPCDTQRRQLFEETRRQGIHFGPSCRCCNEHSGNEGSR